MARSTYIYLAMDQHWDIMVTGTVKREILARVQRDYPHIVTEIRRYRDGGDGSYGIIPPQEWSMGIMGAPDLNTKATE